MKANGVRKCKTEWDVERIGKSYLKSYQKMEVLRTHLIPKIWHDTFSHQKNSDEKSRPTDKEVGQKMATPTEGLSIVNDPLSKHTRRPWNQEGSGYHDHTKERYLETTKGHVIYKRPGCAGATADNERRYH